MKRVTVMHSLILLVGSLLCRLAGASEKPVDRIPAIEAAVVGNLGTDQGKIYADTVNAVIREKFPAVLKACRDSITDSDQSGFSIFLMFNRRGGIKDLVLHPKTKAGECLAATAFRESFPEPPGGNYWVKAVMAGSHPK